MQVLKEPISACEVSLQIEVEPEKVGHAVDQAYREFARYISVPGFRKGRAPLSFVKSRVPKSQLQERTAEILVEPAYQEALQQEDVHPFAAPKLELIALETQPPEQKFQFKALVPLAPQITLGDYAAVAVERRRTEVTDADVEQRIQSMRERAAEFPIIEGRASVMGDVLITELSIIPEGAEVSEVRPTVIQLGDADNIPGLDQNLVGVSTGDEKTFTITYPEDYPNVDVAGRNAEFHVKVNEIHERKLPELDNEFAKKAGGVETIEELRRAFRTDLEKYDMELAEREMEAQLVDKVVSASQVEYPGVLRESEVDDDVRAFLSDIERRNMDIDRFLEQSGQTRESLTQEFETRANRRIQRGLVLGEIARREKLLVGEEDIDKEINARAEAQRTTPAAMRAYIEANKQTDAVHNAAQMKKVLGFLTAAAIITDKVVHPGESGDTAKQTASSAPVEEKKPKTRARKPKAKSEEAVAAGED